MRSDPTYLFQELTWKATLGVLSVIGNICKILLAEIFGVVKLRLKNLLLFCKKKENIKVKIYG